METIILILIVVIFTFFSSRKDKRYIYLVEEFDSLRAKEKRGGV